MRKFIVTCKSQGISNFNLNDLGKMGVHISISKTLISMISHIKQILFSIFVETFSVLSMKYNVFLMKATMLDKMFVTMKIKQHWAGSENFKVSLCISFDSFCQNISGSEMSSRPYPWTFWRFL